MTCKDTNNIHIRFPRSGLELQPYTVDFRIDRTKFNYFEAKFSKEVGDYLEPYIRVEHSTLREPQPVEVVMDERVSHWMYFRPQYVTLGETNCWIELQDPLKHLKYDVVDYKLAGTIEDVYQMILDNANTGDIIKDIEFAIKPDDKSYLPFGATLREEAYSGQDALSDENFMSDTPWYVDTYRSVQNWTRDYDEEAVSSQRILNTAYTFDVENQTALDALFEVNDRVGLQTWLTHDGILKVGNDVYDSTTHVAASGDPRVWRYNDVEITPPGSPIKLAVVNGGMIDEPNKVFQVGEGESNAESVIEFLNPSDSHREDLLAQGVAQNPGVIDGKIVSIDEPDIAQDGLEARAEQFLLNEISNNNSGSLTINPDASGTAISDWRDVRVGDFLELVPPEDEDCRDLEHQILMISGVSHSIEGGGWEIDLNVQKWIDTNPTTSLRYFDPNSTTYYDDELEEIYTADDD